MAASCRWCVFDILWWFNMQFGLRFGFGTDSTHGALQTVDDARQQLLQPSRPVGIRSLKTMSTIIEPWPESMMFDLDTRMAALRHDRKRSDEVDASADMSQKEKDAVRRDLRSRDHRFIDQLHLAHQGIYGSDPVRQRLIHFWFNHFTIGGGRESNFMNGHVIQHVIGTGIDGRFADLAYDITRHPGMLSYLDNIYNVGEKSQRARKLGKSVQIGLNDNLARELMELHTTSPSIGYTEADIRQAAKILSGWGDIFDNPKTVKNFKDAGITDFHNAYFENKAEPGKKTVLGKTYPAGPEALQLLVEDLAASEHTARHLCHKLCVHFIADNPSSQDVAHLQSVWRDSDGHLPAVHDALLERAAASSQPKFQWPLTWLITVLRMSQANMIQGFDDLHRELLSHGGEYRVEKLYREIGQDFWSQRQPDGYSVLGVDWISPEHFERRMRLAAMIFDHGRPQRRADELMTLLDVSAATRALVDKGSSAKARFILLCCSQEFMGA